jgi:hypothetical protein
MDYNISDVEFLSDEINEMYYRIVKINLFIGGVILITTLTNMSMICSMKNKIYQIKNNLLPPNYK